MPRGVGLAIRLQRTQRSANRGLGLAKAQKMTNLNPLFLPFFLLFLFCFDFFLQLMFLLFMTCH